MKIYLPTDRVLIKQGEIEIIVSPLSHADKILVASKMIVIDGKSQVTVAQMVETLRLAVKGFKGFKGADGEEIEPEFDEAGKLSVELAEALYDTLSGTELNIALLNITGKKFADAEKIEGVEMKILPKQKA